MKQNQVTPTTSLPGDLSCPDKNGRKHPLKAWAWPSGSPWLERGVKTTKCQQFVSPGFLKRFRFCWKVRKNIFIPKILDLVESEMGLRGKIKYLPRIKGKVAAKPEEIKSFSPNVILRFGIILSNRKIYCLFWPSFSQYFWEKVYRTNHCRKQLAGPGYSIGDVV